MTNLVTYYFAVKNLSELYSLGWLRSKKEAIINSDNNFQNALHNALNYQNIERGPQRISKLKRYINRYNWEGIEFPAGPKDWKKRQLFLILFVPHNRKTIVVAHRSEYNNKRKTQVILLMIIDGKKWHYLGVTNLPALFKAKLSNHHEDFYRLNCFNSYTTKNNRKEHEKICNKHDSCHIEMPRCF